MIGDEKNPKKQAKPSSEIAPKSVAKTLSRPDHYLADLSQKQYKELQEIENRVLLKSGNIDDLEAAIGVLRMGHHFGWKVLYIAHSKKTIKKFEALLEINVKDFFEEKGPSADRAVGLRQAEEHVNFWKVVKNEITITDRKLID